MQLECIVLQPKQIHQGYCTARFSFPSIQVPAFACQKCTGPAQAASRAADHRPSTMHDVSSEKAIARLLGGDLLAQQDVKLAVQDIEAVQLGRVRQHVVQLPCPLEEVLASWPRIVIVASLGVWEGLHHCIM